MATLNHVCMWSGRGWTPITAEKAAGLHPYGTVSAKSGLFMCELCGQYVILTNGSIRDRYFKHSAYEKSKDCPDRMDNSNSYNYYSYHSNEHELPIRIKGISPSSFRFEIGLIRVPIQLCKKNLQIIINTKNHCYTFTRERINFDGITYLSIGKTPFESCKICIQNGDDSLYEFWPHVVKGIDREGTLFAKDSGKKITYDADVEVEKEYYLLKCGALAVEPKKDLRIRRIAEKKIGRNLWKLYLVSALRFSECAARFYLDFHCRLTEQPASLQVVWPLFVEEDFLIKHNKKSMYMIVKGNVIKEIKTFPEVRSFRRNDFSSSEGLYEIFCSDRQQLISIGRIHALKYTYFWRESLNQTGKNPSVFVSNIDGIEICPGKSYNLPPKGILCVKTEYDSEIVIIKHGVVADKREIAASTRIEIDEISYSTEIQIFIGLDCVWKIELKKEDNVDIHSEVNLLKFITKESGRVIRTPHSLRNIMINMKSYPIVYKWIEKSIRNGMMDEQSYRKLQGIYRDMKIVKGDII